MAPGCYEPESARWSLQSIQHLWNAPPCVDIDQFRLLLAAHRSVILQGWTGESKYPRMGRTRIRGSRAPSQREGRNGSQISPIKPSRETQDPSPREENAASASPIVLGSVSSFFNRNPFVAPLSQLQGVTKASVGILKKFNRVVVTTPWV